MKKLFFKTIFALSFSSLLLLGSCNDKLEKVDLNQSWEKYLECYNQCEADAKSAFKKYEKCKDECDDARAKEISTTCRHHLETGTPRGRELYFKCIDDAGLRFNSCKGSCGTAYYTEMDQIDARKKACVEAFIKSAGIVPAHSNPN